MVMALSKLTFIAVTTDMANASQDPSIEASLPNTVRFSRPEVNSDDVLISPLKVMISLLMI